MSKLSKGMSRRGFAKMTATGAMALSLGGILSACAGGSQGSTGSSDASTGTGPNGESQVIITMTPSSEPSAGFDPFISWGCGEHVHEPLIQSTLITTDANLEFVNDLATSYECSDDGMEWTFVIRDDVKFTDGEPLTAEDVAFTINGIKESAASQADLTMVNEAVAVDDTTVVIKMAKPFNALLYTLAVVGIVPAHAHDENYGSNPIGSGRYMLEQWDRGQQVILRANPDYYGDAPLMERVVVLFVEEDASLAAAQAGQADVAYTSATLAAGVPQGYTLLNCASVDSRGISLPVVEPGGTIEHQGAEYPTGNAVTCDLALRRAINYAVDRQAVADHVLNGYGRVAYSVSDGMPWSSDDMKCERDVEAAQEMLADAGWVMGDDGVLAKGDVRAEFDLYYAAGDSVRQAIANEFASQMEEIGIKANVIGDSWDVLYQHQFSDPIVWGWGSNSPIEVYNLNYSDGSGNYACLDNASVDYYLDEALAQPRVEDSYDYWKSAQWDGETGFAPQGDASWVWFVNVDHLYFMRDGLTVAEQKPHPHGHGWSLANNVDRWSWN